MEGSQSSSPEDRFRWARLTDKQRACLDLLLERKTSKQIARELKISKYTVDQRITAARQILGAADRDEAAIVYARLKRLCDRVAYDPAQLPPSPTMVPSDFTDGSPSEVLTLQDRSGTADGPSSNRLSSGKIWRHDHRLSIRVMIMATMLVTLIIFLAGSIGIAESLSRLVSR